MPRRELNDAVLGPVSSIDSNDKGFLDIQKKIRDFVLRNDDYFEAMISWWKNATKTSREQTVMHISMQWSGL